jgi:hypothetical protein
VADDLGSLRQRDVIAHVRRARRDGGRPNPSTPPHVPDATPPTGTRISGGSGGAGLGLYLVLANVAALVVNVAPGRRTEIVCVFDLSRGIRPSVTGVRSLHVFSDRATAG